MAGDETITITGIAHGGEGVGRGADQRVIFVHGALPGETVRVEVTESKKRFHRGHVLEVIEASSGRVEPPCPVHGRCGGCRWQYAEPALQLQLKRRIVAEQLGLDVTAAVPSPSSTGYRRRARMHYVNGAGGLELGFFGRGSKVPVGHEHCLVLDDPLNHAFDRARRLGEILPEHGEILGLSDGTKAILGLPGVRPEEASEALCATLVDDVLVGITLRGGRQRAAVGRATLEIDGRNEIGIVATPFSFAQAQSAQNEALVNHVVQACGARGKRVVELYAGSGNFTRALARQATRVFTCDDDRESVAALRELAERAELPINAKVDKAETFAKKLRGHERRYDVVLCDPPRAGLGLALAATVAELAAERIVYVSCDPATLARDVKVITEGGFAVRSVTVFDLMPMTPEVETVAVFDRVTAPRGAHG